MRLRRILAATLAYLALLGPVGLLGLATACGGSSSNTPPPAPAPPVITSFAAAKSPITSGTSTTLTAVFANGVGTLMPGAIAITSGTPLTVSPALTTTFTLTVVNSAQQSLSQTATVTVVPAPAIASFSPAALGIVLGTSTTLTPTFSGGIGSIDQGIGAVTSGQAVTVSPTGLTTYTLTVLNEAGMATTAQTTVGIITSPAGGTALAITADSLVTAGRGGRVASTQAFGPGTTYAWTLSNGTVTAGQNTASITYTPGTTGTLGLAVRATNALGTASASASATVVAALPNAKVFCQDKVHPGEANQLASMPGGPGLSLAWSLSAGVIHGATDQEVLRFSPPLALGPFTLTATLSNAAGDAVTDTHTLQVVAGEWLGDPRLGRTGGWGVYLGDGRTLQVNLDSTWTDYNPRADYYQQVWYPACQLLDPLSGTHRPTAGAPQWEISTHLHVVKDGRLLSLLGLHPTGPFQPWAQNPWCDVYDPATDAWTKAASVPAGHMTDQDVYRSIVMADGRVMALGGGWVNYNTMVWTGSNQVHIYDPATDAWQAAAPMHEIRGMPSSAINFSAVPLRDGRVFVAGGGTWSWPYDPAVTPGLQEIYDPTSDQWTLCAQASFPNDPYFGSFAGLPLDGATAWNMNDGAVQLPDGRILLYGAVATSPGGGAAYKIYTDTYPDGSSYTHGFVALYDPAADAWTFRKHDSSGLMNPPLAITLLPNGKVWMEGLPDTHDSMWGMGGPGYPRALYDPVTDTSKSIATLPADYETWVYASWLDDLPKEDVLPDGRIGRRSGSTNITLSSPIYDPATDTWAVLPDDLALPRFQHTATPLPTGQVLFVGGVVTNAITNAPRVMDAQQAQIFDVSATKTWVPVGSLLEARVYHGAALLGDGRVLVAGGTGLNGTVLASAEAYDPATQAFSALAPMSTPRFSHTITALADGRVLAAGGTNLDAYLNSVELYDPATDRWSPGAPMGAIRESHTATLLADGRVLVVGGGDRLNVAASAEVYDPARNTWTTVPAPAHGRIFHRSVLLGDGRVLVTGGKTTGGGVLNDAEIYDPATNQWSSAGTFDGVRENHAITLLADGQVLLSGGQTLDANSSQPTCVVYDPATNHWTNTGALANSRGSHTATLLPDGRVLVFGGNHHYYNGGLTMFMNATLSLPEFWK